MPKARMLAGGMVEPGAGSPGAVVAYVAVSGGRLGSRLFRVDGSPNAPVVRELGAETTLDLNRFTRETERELRPARQAIERLGGVSTLTVPKQAWICDEVRAYLKAREGIDVE